jgi:hypothetical protein
MTVKAGPRTGFPSAMLAAFARVDKGERIRTDRLIEHRIVLVRLAERLGIDGERKRYGADGCTERSSGKRSRRLILDPCFTHRSIAPTIDHIQLTRDGKLTIDARGEERFDLVDRRLRQQRRIGLTGVCELPPQRNDRFPTDSEIGQSEIVAEIALAKLVRRAQRTVAGIAL